MGWYIGPEEHPFGGVSGCSLLGDERDQPGPKKNTIHRPWVSNR
ncbi:hypothetical protein CM15mP35_05260 [bacterium]|nr:MAG: hypothetical protein CM15mP35_05260 [bacterium]